jgi:hypothetical protein
MAKTCKHGIQQWRGDFIVCCDCGATRARSIVFGGETYPPGSIWMGDDQTSRIVENHPNEINEIQTPISHRAS